MTYEQERGQTKSGNSVPTSGYTGEAGRRLAIVIEALGGLRQSAEVARVTTEQVARWRDGKAKWSFFSVAAMCVDAGYSLDWLFRGISLEKTTEGPQLTLIPRLDIEPAAGAGSIAISEEPVAFLAFDSDWLRRRGINPKNAHVLTARGDSMEPTIRSGDILLVDTSIDRIDDNGIYIVRVGGMLLLKRIHVKMNRSLLLISDNKDLYPPEDVAADEAVDIFVAGRVMWFGRSI